MEIKIEISDWKLNEFATKAIEGAITDYINTEVAKVVGELDINVVANTVVDHIKTRIRYGKDNDGYNDEICQLLDKRVAELVANIDDEFLKNTIMERLIKKM